MDNDKPNLIGDLTKVMYGERGTCHPTWSYVAKTFNASSDPHNLYPSYNFVTHKMMHSWWDVFAAFVHGPEVELECVDGNPLYDERELDINEPAPDKYMRAAAQLAHMPLPSWITGHETVDMVQLK